MNERECRRIVTERAQGRCERCGFYRPLTMHHRRKRSQGGPWSPANIVAVCGHGTLGCHGRVEAQPAEANAEGFWLMAGEPPHTPLRYRGHWAVLTDDGRVEFDLTRTNQEVELG